MSAKYVVNGKEYASIEAMPAEFRSVYQSLGGLLVDADHNGIPDIMEGKGGKASFRTSSVAVNIVHDGKVYTSASDLPPELREKYDKAMQAFGGVDSSGVVGSGVMPATISNMFSTAVTAHILHDGKVFTDPSLLPPEARERYEKATKLLGDANQNGIPDILESASPLRAAGVTSTPSGAQTATVSSAPSMAQTAVPSKPSAAQSVPPPPWRADSGGRTLMIAAMLMLLLAGVVVLVTLIMVIQSR